VIILIDALVAQTAVRTLLFGVRTKGHLFAKTYLTKLSNRFVVQFFFVELIYV